MHEQEPRQPLSAEAQAIIRNNMLDLILAGLAHKYHARQDTFRRSMAEERARTSDQKIERLIDAFSSGSEESLAAELPLAVLVDGETVQDAKEFMLAKVHPITGRVLEWSAIIIGTIYEDGRIEPDTVSQEAHLGFTETELLLVKEIWERQQEAGIELWFA